MRATSLAAFLAAARETFARGDGPGARRTLALLDDLEIPARTRVPTPGEPPGELIELLATAADTPCLAALREVSRDLDWRRSPRSNGPVAELVGPDGTLTHHGLRCGLFVLPRRHLYAEHVHAADEVYAVLAGAGEWSLGSAGFAAKAPGDLVEVPSMTPHALRTGPRALLMLWSWTGDITFDRYRFTS